MDNNRIRLLMERMRPQAQVETLRREHEADRERRAYLMGVALALVALAMTVSGG